MILVIALAVVTEAVIEYGKQIGKAVAAREWKTAVTQLCAVALSVLLCWGAGADLFSVAGIVFGWAPLGKLLTGVLASRGANYISDFGHQLCRLSEKSSVS